MSYCVSGSLESMKLLYSDEFAEAQKDNFEWNRLSDFKLSILVAVSCYFQDWLVVRLMWNTMYDLCKEKTDEGLRLIKTAKATDKCYQFVYMVLVNIYGYSVLSKTEYLPYMMMG